MLREAVNKKFCPFFLFWRGIKLGKKKRKKAKSKGSEREVKEKESFFSKGFFRRKKSFQKVKKKR